MAQDHREPTAVPPLHRQQKPTGTPRKSSPSPCPSAHDRNKHLQRRFPFRQARGVYPTLEERAQFASVACDYLDKELNRALISTSCCIVSFSFVNTDLRDAFRRRFPHAQWWLYDTPESLAAERIKQRRGHFYTLAEGNEEAAASAARGSEWAFAPVDFAHEVIDGTADLQQNVARCLRDMQGECSVSVRNQDMNGKRRGP